MMDMRAELRIGVDDQRGDARHETELAGGVRRSGSMRVPGVVRDISCSGFRIESEEKLPTDAVVWLKIGTLEPLMARVVWSDRLLAGCRFAAPLHPLILERLLHDAG
ncbi:PilZ domain-containing protein [Sphingomonas morindae]|uniref:PilZ domain-containing protein n=1 Tax=Sphingomonas morindae TaxID=1541170 RepID=A0ABY4X8L7_9SPHN|nr:PilZ domain-containing protein [Sphingomonas morindae]USI73253.1 PilZ domain-containing protein [Sphingomonas morindae]